MTTYQPADADTNDRIQRLVQRYHGLLHEAKVTIDCLFVKAKKNDNGDSVGPALKLHGVQCAAIVKINNLKLRTQGHGDAEIQLDGDRWYDWEEEVQEAILDHEIHHLEIVPLIEGSKTAKTDDLGRPRLKMRPHDHDFGWFDAIVRRHGTSSLEHRQWSAFEERRVQMWLPMFDGDPPQGDGKVTKVTLTAKTGKGTKSVTLTDKQFKAATASVIAAAQRPRKTKSKS